MIGQIATYLVLAMVRLVWVEGIYQNPVVMGIPMGSMAWASKGGFITQAQESKAGMVLSLFGGGWNSPHRNAILYFIPFAR